MFTCADCKKTFSEQDRSPWKEVDKCLACMTKRLSDQRALESHEIVKGSSGWEVAYSYMGGTFYVECEHHHPSRAEAETCLRDGKMWDLKFDR